MAATACGQDFFYGNDLLTLWREAKMNETRLSEPTKV